MSNGPTGAEGSPLITVVTAVYNGADTLERCVRSVAGQTYPRVQFVVIDGGSTDGTVDILRDNAGGIDHWETGPDRGIYHAWNKGLRHADGRWVCFLGADDFFWRADVLERMVPHLAQADGRHRIVYGKAAVLDAAGRVRALWGAPWPRERSRFLQGIMRVPHPGLFHHEELFRRSGPFDDSFQSAGDYEFLLRELKQAPALHVPDILVAGMTAGGTTHRVRNRFRSMREVLRARRIHRIPGVPWRLARAWVLNSLLLFVTGLLGRRRTARLTAALKPPVPEDAYERHAAW